MRHERRVDDSGPPGAECGALSTGSASMAQMKR
jgi:hypothetical protein